MKTFKLTKKMTRDLSLLLTKVGAVDANKKQAYPSHVYVSKQDYRKIRQELTKVAKQERPYLKKLRIQTIVGMELLNLGPVELDGVKEGFVLVDTRSIESEIQAGAKA